MNKLICPECWKQNPEDAMHCSYCGASLKGAKIIVESSKPVPPSDKQQPSVPASYTPQSNIPTKSTGIGPTSVVIVDFNMPFWSLVVFLVKVALAAIPAAIILFFIFAILRVIFVGIFSAIL